VLKLTRQTKSIARPLCDSTATCIYLQEITERTGSSTVVHGLNTLYPSKQRHSQTKTSKPSILCGFMALTFSTHAICHSVISCGALGHVLPPSGSCTRTLVWKFHYIYLQCMGSDRLHGSEDAPVHHTCCSTVQFSVYYIYVEISVISA